MAAICTTVAFVPQIVKLRKQGGEDLSYQMLFLYLTGVLLWLVYGIRVHAVAVIWANALAAVMVLISIMLKANPPRRSSTHSRKILEQSSFASPSIWTKSSPTAFGKQLDIYNQRTGANLTRKWSRAKDWAALIPHDRWEDLQAFPTKTDFLPTLSLIAGSREALLELSRNHDVYIASAAMEVPSSFDGKYQWMQKNFPFIPTSQIVFCGDKNIINADVLVDDRSRHFKEFRGTGNSVYRPAQCRAKRRTCGRTTGMMCCEILGGGQPEAAGEEQRV